MTICWGRGRKRNGGSCSLRCECGSENEIGKRSLFIWFSAALCPFLQDHETPDLRLLLAMTDLLASCSEGENLFIESVCQTVYSVEELLEILQNPYLPPERKRPFARFLVWVYMNTEGDKMQSGASEVANQK